MITKIFPTLLTLVVLTTLALILPSQAQNTPRDYVAAHNAARAAVGVGPVTWDAKVAAYAQSYAQRLASRGCKLVHSGGSYGENLAWGKPDITGTASVNMWVDEKQHYNYNTNKCAPGKVCGHYTQVVWRNSTQIGCGRAVCPNRAGTIVSCNYNPPGNIAGQKPYLFISDN